MLAKTQIDAECFALGLPDRPEPDFVPEAVVGRALPTGFRGPGRLVARVSLPASLVDLQLQRVYESTQPARFQSSSLELSVIDFTPSAEDVFKGF